MLSFSFVIQPRPVKPRSAFQATPAANVKIRDDQSWIMLQRMKSCVNQLAHVWLVEGWNQWLDVISYERLLKGVLSQFLHSMTYLWFKKSWSKWCEVARVDAKAESVSELEQLKARLGRETMFRFLFARLRHVWRRIVTSHQISLYEEQLANEMMLRCMENLSETQSGFVMLRCLSKIRLNAIFRGFWHWVDTLWYERYMGGVIIRCLDRMVQWSVGQGWGKWCKYVAYSMQHKGQAITNSKVGAGNIVLHFFEKRTQRIVSLSWAHWKHVLLEEERAARLVYRCLDRLSRLFLRQGWNKWLELKDTSVGSAGDIP